MSEELETNPWARYSPRWGHPWHRMCSYLGTFPPALARTFIATLSEPGDIVLDPFSGRGTTLLEARLLERYPLASDLNPVAIALTGAKNSSVVKEAVLNRLRELECRFDKVTYLPEARVQPEDIQLIYNTDTLAELCYLRRRLVKSDTEIDQFLIGTVLGVMHGSERNNGTSGYASINMPNTFSMSPGYVRKFVERKLSRPYRNAFEVLEEKISRLFEGDAADGVTEPSGIVEWCDVKVLTNNEAFAPYKGKVKLILTSPPYLDIVNYAKQNWIRNWFMANHPEYYWSEALDDALTLDRWVKFSEAATLEMKEMLAPDGAIVLVVGDVSRGSRGFISLAREFIQRALHHDLFDYVGCFDDEIRDGVKTTRIWGDTKGKATETDRIVILANEAPEFKTERLMHIFGETGKVLPSDLDLMDSASLAEHAKQFAAVTEEAPKAPAETA